MGRVVPLKLVKGPYYLTVPPPPPPPPRHIAQEILTRRIKNEVTTRHKMIPDSQSFFVLTPASSLGTRVR